MEFLNSLKKRSKHYSTPFSHWELNEPLTEDAVKEDPVQKQVTQQKKVANTKKKIEAAEKQPPAMKGKNKVEQKVDVSTMSVEEFDALPAETLRRMRGDFG